MPTLAPLGARVSAPADTPHPRHTAALPLLQELRSRSLSVLSPRQLQALDALEARLLEARSVHLPPDSHFWRNQLVGIRETSIRARATIGSDLARDLLLTLFGHRDFTLASTCDNPPCGTTALRIHGRFLAMLQGGQLHACLVSAESALMCLSYALGHDHTALSRRIHQDVQSRLQSGWTWTSEPGAWRPEFLYDGLRCRVVTEYGAHALVLRAPDGATQSLHWAPIYGRILGRCTVVGFDEGFWGEP